VAPDCSSPGFAGSWSNYPKNESSVVAVASIEKSLALSKAFTLEYKMHVVQTYYGLSRENELTALDGFSQNQPLAAGLPKQPLLGPTGSQLPYSSLQLSGAVPPCILKDTKVFLLTIKLAKSSSSRS
jgi:hypothetical protein